MYHMIACYGAMRQIGVFGTEVGIFLQLAI